MLQKQSRSALMAILVCLTVLSSPTLGEEAKPNLIPNPEFRESQLGESGLPEGWHLNNRKIPGVAPSRIYSCRVAGHFKKLLAIEGGPDRNGRVWCQIKNIRPGTDYLLEFITYRPKFINGVYFEVEIFGQRHLINQHFSFGRLQSIFLTVNSKNFRGTTRLIIENPHREVLAFGSPSLTKVQRGSEKDGVRLNQLRLPSFFPVGIYAVKPEDLPDIRAAGFNAVQSYDSTPQNLRKMASECGRLGLKFLPSFSFYRADLSRDLGGRPELLGFYIEDEPEGRSVLPERMRDLKDTLKHDHPGVLTAVAMLRPRMVSEYKNAADIFMLDPYPVPNLPMTWLSDTLEEASQYVPRERLWAVIQAFGGGDEHVKYGWSRLPTYLEMRCLTYLALVHGAHGIFFFSFPEAHRDSTTWTGLKRIAGELRRLQAWLVRPNKPPTLKLEMTSPFKTDAVGDPAVHFCQKSQENESFLILVNVIDRPVSFYLQGFPPEVPWLTELFKRNKSAVQDGNIREELGPYEVRLYSYRHYE